MDTLPDPSEDVIDAGTAAVAARAGTSPTTIRTMAAQLLAEEGLGRSPAELWQAVGEVGNLLDGVPHTRSLADRAFEADGEVVRLGRLAQHISRGRRRA
jgi:hypothetical protein